MEAYVWRTGRVEFGSRVPKGALRIAEGKGREFKEGIQIKCRLAYPQYVDGVEQPQAYLLPGVPEAQNEQEALEAVKKFKNWIEGYSHDPKEEAERAANKLDGNLAIITINK